MADSGKGGNEEHEMTNRKMSESGQPANNQNNHVQKSENSKKSLKKKGMKSATLVKIWPKFNSTLNCGQIIFLVSNCLFATTN